MGRPSSYQRKVAEKVLAAVAEGRSLREACSQAGMPHRDTVRAWYAKHEEFRVAFDQARQLGADLLAAEIDELLDSIPEKIRQAVAEGINENAVVMGVRTQLDGKKWLLSKISPRYADHQRIEHSGPGGRDLIPEASEDRLAALLGRVVGRVIDHDEPALAAEALSPPAVGHPPNGRLLAEDRGTPTNFLENSEHKAAPPDPADDPDALRSWDDVPGQMSAATRQRVLAAGVVLNRPEPDRTYGIQRAPGADPFRPGADQPLVRRRR